MIISLAPFATALQKSSVFATGRVSRTQNIISKKIMTNNSRTDAQQATRLEMGAGQKFVPNIRTATFFFVSSCHNSGVSPVTTIRSKR